MRGAEPLVGVTAVWPEGAMAAMHALDAQLRVHTGGDPASGDELRKLVAGTDAIIPTVIDTIDAAVMDAAGPSLRIIANGGVGVDNIDLAAAEQRGVVVTNTPGVLDQATADLTMALILDTARRTVEADRFMRSGQSWHWAPKLFTGLDLSSGTELGIVGLGRIGMAVAKRAHAFGMGLLATGSRASESEAQALGVRAVTLKELLVCADVVSLHCPLTPETHHLIGADELAAMNTSSILVNTARGPVVDESALVAALTAGTIAAAGLDVFEREPHLHPGLRDLPNVVLLPHIGSAGTRTRDRMGELAAENVAAVLAADEPLTPVHPASNPGPDSET